MRVYKKHEQALIPEYATAGSACFDLRACFSMGDKIKGYNPHNKALEIPVKMHNDKLMVQIHASFRMLIPTGLIFDIPNKHVMDIFIRSSMAYKYGLVLANGVAKIDSDYTDETYLLLLNTSDTPIMIYHGDRLAQAELREYKQVNLAERKTPVQQKTGRDGGLGSTGVE